MSRKLRRILRSSTLAVALLAPPFGVARAQSVPSLVVIVSADPAAPTSQRVAKDLRGLGLDVLVLKATPENSSGRASLERSARSVGAIAALRLIEAGEGMEVWVADRATGKTVIRQLVAQPGTPSEPEDVALGAVELLRASLMELHAPTPNRGEVELTPAVREIAYPPAPAAPPPPAPHEPIVSLSAGPAVDLGLRALGPSLHASMGAWLKLSGPLGARAILSLPLITERSTVPEGRIQLSAEVLGVGLSYERARAGAWLTPQATVGIAVTHLSTWGRAAAPFVSSYEQGWYAGAYAQLGAALRIARGMRLRLDGTAVVLASPPNATVVQETGSPGITRTIGTWGGPAGIASLALEVQWAP